MRKPVSEEDKGVGFSGQIKRLMCQEGYIFFEDSMFLSFSTLGIVLLFSLFHIRIALFSC